MLKFTRNTRNTDVQRNKDNPILVSFLLYFVPTHPRLLIFQSPWSTPLFILIPPFIMNLRVTLLTSLNISISSILRSLLR